MLRRQLTCFTANVVACSYLALVGPDAALADTWPTRTITTIVPFTAGSASDVVTRIVLDQVSKQVGQPIVIENRGGAGGTLGARLVAQAAPDGYTVLSTGALSVTHAMRRTLPYDTHQDFVPVIPLGFQPMVLVTSPTKGFKTLHDLISVAKTKPGVLNFASTGLGSPSHFAAERLSISAGIKAQHIPFRGAPDGLTEVLTGRVDYFFVTLAPALSLIEHGKLVALAISAGQRVTPLPSVPTTTEAGVADAAYDFWVGLYLPAKTPADIVVKLHRETEIALQVPSVRELLTKLGVEPMPMSREHFAKFFRDDLEANVSLVRAANIAKE